MISPPHPSLSARSLGVLIVLALAPLWLSGMFGRGLWTPDEPREADIAWRMSRQTDHTLPQLAGTPAEYQQALGDAKVKVFPIQPGEKIAF